MIKNENEQKKNLKKRENITKGMAKRKKNNR